MSPVTKTLSGLSSEVLNSAKVGKMTGISSPRKRNTSTAGDSSAAGRQPGDSKRLYKDNNVSLRIDVFCDDRLQQDSEATRKEYLDELAAAEAGRDVIGQGSLKCHKRHKSPTPILPSAHYLSIKTAAQAFIREALKICGSLFLLALFVVVFHHGHSSKHSNNVVGDLSHDNFISVKTSSGTKRSFPRSLLAAGLSSMAAKLDEDTVDKYAKPKESLRKSLLSARDEMETKQHDMEALQEYYEKRIKTINEEFDAEKEVYEQRLHDQEAVLDDVYGEDIPRTRRGLHRGGLGLPHGVAEEPGARDPRLRDGLDVAPERKEVESKDGTHRLLDVGYLDVAVRLCVHLVGYPGQDPGRDALVGLREPSPREALEGAAVKREADLPGPERELPRRHVQDRVRLELPEPRLDAGHLPEARHARGGRRQNLAVHEVWDDSREPLVVREGLDHLINRGIHNHASYYRCPVELAGPLHNPAGAVL